MKKTILLLLTLSLILGVFASCQKRYLHIDDETSSSPSKETTTEREETTEDEDSDITIKTTSEENESVSAITTAISEDTLDLTSDTQGLANMPEEKEYTYTVEKIDGNYYLVFNDYVKSSTYEPFGDSITVPSIDYLKDTIPSGNMDTGLKYKVMLRINDNDPDHKVKIYDVEHVWQPTFPDSFPARSPSVIELISFTNYVFRAPFVEAPEWLGTYPGFYASVLLPEDYIKELESAEDLVSRGYSKKELRDGNKVYTVYSRSVESPDVPGTYRYFYYILATNGKYYGTIDTTLDYELTDAELLQFGFEEYLG